MMQDYCVRAITVDGQIRAFAATTTGVCEEARKRHDTYPTATAALGRVLTGALMMGMDLQPNNTLTIRVLGDGPLNAIIAVAEHNGEVRGYVGNPHIHLPSKYPGKLNVGGAVGNNGYLHITKDIGLRDPYTGSVELVSGEIAEDFTRYFLESEQIQSVISLGVLVETDNHVRAAGGYIIQLLPGATEETIDKLEKKLGQLMPVSNMIDAGMSPENILQEVLSDFEIKITASQEVAFKCKCSQERLERVLINLGADELEDMIEKENGAELQCHFCNDIYTFKSNELKKLILETKKIVSKS